MSTDLRELLVSAAARPTSEPDIAALIGAARLRRRRRIGIALACVVVLAITVGVALLATGSKDSLTVAVVPRDQASAPAGWTEIVLPEAGVRLAVPPGWASVQGGGSTNPSALVVVGTASLASGNVITACSPNIGQTPDGAGTWLSLYEYRDAPAGNELVDPVGISVLPQPIIDRPSDFTTIQGNRGECATASEPAAGPQRTSAFETIAFRDAGRLFFVRIVTTAQPNDPELRLGHQILNTFRVDAAQTTETTTTTLKPTVTTGTPTPDNTATDASDEEQIRAAFLGWIYKQPKDGVNEYVEDFESIADSVRQGIAQHTADDLAKYSGRVDSVQIIDATHANVRYTILWDGDPQYAQQPGQAVKIDGVWKVTRDTVCNLLKYGGITCPPRSAT
jgi:hypothetical protein